MTIVKTELTETFFSRLKEAHILLSNDGPYRNVLKFKSPLVFSEGDAQELLQTLDRILTEMENAEVCKVNVINPLTHEFIFGTFRKMFLWVFLCWYSVARW